MQIDRTTIIWGTLLFFAYVFSITTTGSLQARINRWMGDESADEAGFSEFNPFIHIGLFDLIFFILVQFMIGSPIPVDIRNIKKNHRPIRLFLTFGFRAIMYLVLAVTASIALALLIKTQVGTKILNQPQSFLSMAEQGTSPLVFVLSLFLGLMKWTTTLLGAFSAIRDAVYGYVLVKFEKDASFIEYANPIMIFGVLLLLIFFGNPVTSACAYVVDAMANGILSLVGIIW